jgi:hypothetical protein
MAVPAITGRHPDIGAATIALGRAQGTTVARISHRGVPGTPEGIPAARQRRQPRRPAAAIRAARGPNVAARTAARRRANSAAQPFRAEAVSAQWVLADRVSTTPTRGPR